MIPLQAINYQAIFCRPDGTKKIARSSNPGNELPGYFQMSRWDMDNKTLFLPIRPLDRLNDYGHKPGLFNKVLAPTLPRGNR
jgi:hypothetical protein